jgi:D-sedoheptulose 7-phosphate isomerase
MATDVELIERLKERMEMSREVYRLAFELLHPTVIACAKGIAECLEHGGKILICGNGGSAADAQHFAAECIVRLVGHFNRKPLAAIALTTDSSVLTAGGNDYGYESIFERQVQALGKPEDFFVGITTSGTSPNILKALDAARSIGMKTAIFTGSKGCPSLPINYLFDVPCDRTAIVQECHISLEHSVIDMVEVLLLDKSLNFRT